MNETPLRRLLVPVSAASARARGIAYPHRCLAAGLPVEVCLLHVIEPVEAWQVLRFLTRDEVARFQERRAADCLARNSAILVEEGVPFHAVIRKGRLIESIVGVADELACTEIVVPAPALGLWGGWGNNLAVRLARHGVRTPLTLMH